MHDIIRIEHLSKRFGEVQAVQDLSFRVKEGELFAFLGVNGAGKSTTINILCGQLAKDGGSVEIDGADPDRDPDRVRRELGVVFQNSVLDGALSVRDNLQSRAALYGIRGAAFAKRLAELAQLLDFGAILDRPVGRLSGGQRRRIDIARALLHRPKILIFDEPTTGLDPQTRRLLWDVVTELRRKEKLTVGSKAEDGFRSPEKCRFRAPAPPVEKLTVGHRAKGGFQSPTKHRFQETGTFKRQSTPVPGTPGRRDVFAPTPQRESGTPERKDAFAPAKAR